MKVSYNKLFEKLKTEGITQKVFRDDARVNGNTLNKMLHGESVTIATICNICDYLQCMPDEIMDFVPDENYPVNVIKRQKMKAELEKQISELQQELKAKSAIEAQIAELQEKLKQI